MAKECAINPGLYRKKENSIFRALRRAAWTIEWTMIWQTRNGCRTWRRFRNVLWSSSYPFRRRMPFQSPVGFESGTRRGGRVIGLLAPLIPEYWQWFSANFQLDKENPMIDFNFIWVYSYNILSRNRERHFFPSFVSINLQSQCIIIVQRCNCIVSYRAVTFKHPNERFDALFLKWYDQRSDHIYWKMIL